MKIFTFTCSMNYIGGTGIVIAPNIDKALELVNQLPELKDPVKKEDLQLIKKQEGVTLITNGDY